MSLSLSTRVSLNRSLPLCVACCLLALATSVHGAEKKPAKDDEKGFVSLFNGKDLTGWRGNMKAWAVRDGAITCVGGKTEKNWLIWRDGEVSDFELRLQFKFTQGNSGVQVRSKEISKWQVRGYQVEIAAHNKMGLWHHSLSPSKHRSKLALAGQKVLIAKDGEKQVESIGDPDKIKAGCKDDQWNDLVVIARGPRLIQKINGVVFSDLTDHEEAYATRSGLLALQDHGKGCVAAFKNIRIKHFKTAKEK